MKKKEEYYEKTNNVLHVTKKGLIALAEKYGVRAEVMSDTNIDFYRAQVKILSDQLEETKRYNKTFVNLIEMKDQKTEAKENEIKEKEKTTENQKIEIKDLEKRLHQQEFKKTRN